MFVYCSTTSYKLLRLVRYYISNITICFLREYEVYIVNLPHLLLSTTMQSN